MCVQDVTSRLVNNMDDPAYKDVLEALNSLISEKPKAGDKQAYEAAYQSIQTYLEVLNLMLLVRILRLLAHTCQVRSQCSCVDQHAMVAEVGLGVRVKQAQNHSCSWY